MGIKKAIFEVGENSFWIIGLSLFVSGIVQILGGNSFWILGIGLFFAIIAVALKGFNFGNKNNYFGIIYSEDGEIIGGIMKEDIN